MGLTEGARDTSSAPDHLSLMNAHVIRDALAHCAPGVAKVIGKGRLDRGASTDRNVVRCVARLPLWTPGRPQWLPRVGRLVGRRRGPRAGGGLPDASFRRVCHLAGALSSRSD